MPAELYLFDTQGIMVLSFSKPCVNHVSKMCPSLENTPI
jgi:hypothetical protein